MICCLFFGDSDTLKQLLHDDRVRMNLRPDFELRKCDGSRVFAEMHTGDQFKELRRRTPNGAVCLAIVLYMDATWLSANGRASCKPLVICIGNVTREVYVQDFAKKTLLHFRDLGGSKKTRNTTSYRTVSFL